MTRVHPDPNEVREWVEQTRAEQGVPVGIDDMPTLKMIAGIFADQRRENEVRKRAPRQRSATRQS